MRILAALALSLLFVTPSWAAVDCDDPNAVGTWIGTPGSTITRSYTRRDGTNQLMLIGVGSRSGTAGIITGVTVNGNAAEPVTEEAGPPAGNGRMYSFASPPSGTYNVVASYSTAPLHGHLTVMVCNGVDLTGPFRSTNQAAATSTSPSTTLGSIVAGDVAVDFVTSDDSVPPVVGANQTVVVSGVTATSGAAMSRQAGADGGVMSWTIASNPWSIHAGALIAAPSTVTFGHLQRRAD